MEKAPKSLEKVMNCSIHDWDSTRKLNPFESFGLGEIITELEQQLYIQHSATISSKIIESTPSKSNEIVSSEKHLSKPNTMEKVNRNNHSTRLFDTSTMDSPYIKLGHELEFLLKIIQDTKIELETKHSFSSLCEILREQEGDGPCLLSTLTLDLKRRQEQMVKKLEKELEILEESCRTQNRDQLILLNQLKDQVHLTKTKGQEDAAFAELWLSARNDFEKKVTQKNEILDIKLQMQNMKECQETDVEAYENVVAWTRLKVSQIDGKILAWKNKLSKDMSRVKAKIQGKRATLVEQEEKIIALQELIHQRVEELIPWEEEKMQERLERIQHMRRYYSCRKLQRWWRKQMVQHGLYKKKKPKAKASKPKMKTKSPRTKTDHHSNKH